MTFIGLVNLQAILGRLDLHCDSRIDFRHTYDCLVGQLLRTDTFPFKHKDLDWPAFAQDAASAHLAHGDDRIFLEDVTSITATLDAFALAFAQRASLRDRLTAAGSPDTIFSIAPVQQPQAPPTSMPDSELTTVSRSLLQLVDLLRSSPQVSTLGNARAATLNISHHRDAGLIACWYPPCDATVEPFHLICGKCYNFNPLAKACITCNKLGIDKCPGKDCRRPLHGCSAFDPKLHPRLADALVSAAKTGSYRNFHADAKLIPASSYLS
jgi:hypothetical protein